MELRSPNHITLARLFFSDEITVDGKHRVSLSRLVVREIIDGFSKERPKIHFYDDFMDVSEWDCEAQRLSHQILAR